MFGWEIRRRDNGELTFNDGVGEVSGAWVTGHPPADPAGNIMGLYQEPTLA